MKPKPALLKPARDKRLHGVQADCKTCGKLAHFGVLTEKGFVCDDCYDNKLNDDHNQTHKTDNKR